jgi:hypothetical protein
MEMDSESLLALGYALIQYTGKKYFEHLDISKNRISANNLRILSQALFISVRKINLKSINLSCNWIASAEHLGHILLKLNNPIEINLSNNFLE